MRFLITGVTGFVGRHLTTTLLAGGHDVYGTTRALPVHEAPHGTHADRLTLAADHLLACDISDCRRMTEVIGQVRPDGVLHLAAFTSVAASFEDPEAAYRTNVLGSLNLFSAVRAAASGCRIVWVGSSDAYGLVHDEELPVTEQNLFRPLSPYAVSKAAADLAAYQWSRAAGLDIVRLRPFNHTGPGQAPHFVCADFAGQLMAVKRGTRPPRIEVGNLDVVRDFSDVRDVVRAYLAVFERGESGEAYNVCSGQGRSPRDILDRLIRLSGVEVAIVPNPLRQRPADVPVLIGSAAKLRAATGWTPAISWDQTLRDLLEDWRGRLEVAS